MQPFRSKNTFFYRLPLAFIIAPFAMMVRLSPIVMHRCTHCGSVATILGADALAVAGISCVAFSGILVLFFAFSNYTWKIHGATFAVFIFVALLSWTVYSLVTGVRDRLRFRPLPSPPLLAPRP